MPDHLGSVAEITDAAGGIVIAENFTAFGERRDPTDWSGPISPADKLTIASISSRGFTFHTNLEENALVHMNGRVADALTGRFMSADPFIPNAGNTQSFNRYSYVRNNPLTRTDPSGFVDVVPCADTFSCAVTFMVSLYKWGRDNRPPPPPKGCWASAAACHGPASSGKLKKFISDVFDIYERMRGLGTRRSVTPGWGAENGYALYFQDPAMERLNRIFDEVRKTHFEDIPVNFSIVLQLEDIVDMFEVKQNDDKSIDPSVILVNPRVLDIETDAFIALGAGHELVHVRDSIQNPYRAGSPEHYESEIRAYQWQIDNLSKFKLSLDQKLRFRDQTQEKIFDMMAEKKASEILQLLEQGELNFPQ
ncbi:MAG: RHS repeat-associated core domain-containing protein [Woeseia sp.]